MPLYVQEGREKHEHNQKRNKRYKKDSKGDAKRFSRKRSTITASEMKSTLDGLKANKTLQKKR